jgi:hypothetical protein
VTLQGTFAGLTAERVASRNQPSAAASMPALWTTGAMIVRSMCR